MKNEKLKRRYFHRKIIVALGEVILLETLFALSWESNTLQTIFLYITGVVIILLFTYIDYLIERLYRRIEAKFYRYAGFAFLIFIIFTAQISLVLLRNLVNPSLFIELFLLNLLFPLAIFLAYEMPAARKLAGKGEKIEESLREKIEELKERMNVRSAEVYVLNLDDVKIANAMQVGAKGNYVFISSYLMKNLNEEEILAVLAHEFAHIKRGTC